MKSTHEYCDCTLNDDKELRGGGVVEEVKYKSSLLTWGGV